MKTPWRWRPRRDESGLPRGGASAPTQRTTSLRTRSFTVIIIAVHIPATCLAGVGVWIYFRTWDHAATTYTSQALGQDNEVASEINQLGTLQKRYTPAERALLSQAITNAFGIRGQYSGAGYSSLTDIGAEQVLPVWAVKSLKKNGFAIGEFAGPSAPENADVVAWLVAPQTVRYYSGWQSDMKMPVHAPLGRVVPIAVLSGALILVLGLLGAWVLSRSVVRPVRRLAEASGRLAEGERDVAVTPEGPRELRELAASFNDMNAKLTKAQEAEQSFLLSVSHELKTPLTSIRGYAEGIGDGTIKAKAGSAVIGSEAGRLQRLVGDLLDSARMRKSAFTVRRETIDLAALADDVARR